MYLHFFQLGKYSQVSLITSFKTAKFQTSCSFHNVLFLLLQPEFKSRERVKSLKR